MLKIFNQKSTNFSFLLLSFLWLTACGTSTLETENTPVSTIPIQRPTLTPTVTETASATPTQTSTPTLSPDDLSVPTLQPDVATTFVNEMFINPPCHLPCWWNAVPGETTWSENDSFLKYIGADIYAQRVNDNDRFSGFQSINFSNIVDTEGYFRINFTFNLEDVLNTISVDIPVTDRYLLHHFFSQYGQPDEIMVSALFGTSTGASVFRVYLFYESGIAVGYDGRIDETETDGIICLQQPSPVDLYLWDANQTPYSWEDMYDLNVVERGHHYQPLSAATEMSVERFYEMFAEETESACFQTPIEFWEEIY